MHIYKELIFEGNKADFEEFRINLSSCVGGEWKIADYSHPIMKDYVTVEYQGNKVSPSAVSIYIGEDALQEGRIKVMNIVPLNKSQLTIDEYNAVLDLFNQEIIIPNRTKFPNITITGPTSDQFVPENYMSHEALKKLEKFCNAANKSTGSSNPCDEERWFDFICQTVEDNQILDSETLSNFLKDEDYWGVRKRSKIGGTGRCAWDEEHADELALEYENYVKILQYYKSYVK